jgi:hypothetical protein
MEALLYDLKRELSNLSHGNGRGFTCTVRGIIADAPMRAELKNVMSFTGYYGCERCLAKFVFFNLFTLKRNAICFICYRISNYTAKTQAEQNFTDLKVPSLGH